MELLQQILIATATMLGIPAGFIIAAMTREELGPGRKWFSLLSFFSMIAMVAIIIIYITNNQIDIFIAVGMILLIIISLFMFRKSISFYLSLLIIILLSVFYVKNEQFTLLMAAFSFIFLITVTAYSQSFKKQKKKGSKR
jgi:membrane-associated HD superfamily phosphohydrolase